MLHWYNYQNKNWQKGSNSPPSKGLGFKSAEESPKVFHREPDLRNHV